MQCGYQQQQIFSTVHLFPLDHNTCWCRQKHQHDNPICSATLSSLWDLETLNFFLHGRFTHESLAQTEMWNSHRCYATFFLKTPVTTGKAQVHRNFSSLPKKWAKILKTCFHWFVDLFPTQKSLVSTLSFPFCCLIHCYVLNSGRCYKHIDI